jgi:pimeloyl-ACP methyl ester carboxylesterase
LARFNALFRCRGVKVAVFLILIIGAIIVKKFGLPPYYQTNEAVLSLQKSEGFSDDIFAINGEEFHIVQSGEKDLPVILFVHGSPGAWTAWADYLLDEDLRLKAHMIAVDRLGFGGSDNGFHEPDLQKQAKIIMGALGKVSTQKKNIIVVGHSYGGPVALRIAVDYPDKIAFLLLLAPSIDPDLEENRWYNLIADLSFVRALLPKAVDRSNQEILPLKGELLKMRSLLQSIKNKVSIIQGEKDTLVPAGNASFGKRELISAEVDVHLLPERGHFIPWEEYALVKKTLLAHLSSLDLMR